MSLYTRLYLLLWRGPINDLLAWRCRRWRRHAPAWEESVFQHHNGKPVLLRRAFCHQCGIGQIVSEELP
jgi:hypothetical protein